MIIVKKSVSPQLMQTIKNLAIKQGVEITRSQPYPEKPTGDLYEMGINCTWNGELSAIVKFLTELQQKKVFSMTLERLIFLQTGKRTTY